MAAYSMKMLSLSSPPAGRSKYLAAVVRCGGRWQASKGPWVALGGLGWQQQQQQQQQQQHQQIGAPEMRARIPAGPLIGTTH